MDIGDKVKKGDVFATLFVPEMVEDFGTKKATVELDKERIELALKMVKVAEADVQAAAATPRRGRRRSWPSTRPRSTAGRSQVKRLDGRGRPGRGRPPDPARVDQSVEVEHRLRGTRPRRRSSRRRRSCSPDRRRSAKAKVDV